MALPSIHPSLPRQAQTWPFDVAEGHQPVPSSKPGIRGAAHLLLVAILVLVLPAPDSHAQCENYLNYSYDAGLLGIGGHSRDIHVEDNLAYVGVNSAFQILDITDKNSPVLLSNLSFESHVWRVRVSGSIAAVSSYHQIFLYDISNPNTPAELGFLSIDGLCFDFFFDGTVLYCIDEGSGTDYLKSFDLSDPQNPIILSSHEIPTVYYEVRRNLGVYGDYIFIPNWVDGLLVFDKSDPANLVHIGTHSFGFGPACLEISGHVAYIAAGSNCEEFYTVDISNPESLSIIGYESSVNCGFPIFIAKSGNTCFIASNDNNEDIVVIDASDPADPQKINSFPYVGIRHILRVFDAFLYEGGASGFRLKYVGSPDVVTPLSSIVTSGSVQGVVVSDLRNDFAFLADGDGGIKIIDVSDPLAPVLVDSVLTPGFATDVYVSGSSAYVADGGGLQVVDVTDPYSMTSSIVGSMTTPGTSVKIKVVGNYAYIADSEAGLQIANVSDFSDLQIVGSEASLTNCRSVDVSGTLAYVADSVEGLQILDVSDPEDPWIIGGVKTRDWGDATNVEIQGTKAYVSDSTNGLHIIDVSSSDNPVELGTIETSGQALDVSVADGFAYVADSASGLQLIDVSDSSNLTLIGNIEFPENAVSTFTTNELVFVAAEDGGLKICPSQCQVSDIVTAGFHHDFSPGTFYPANVSFSNDSQGYFSHCFWDFGDGVGTSTQVNPSYYFATPGDFQVTLTVYGSGSSSTVSQEIRVLSDEPRISSVQDVPDDQGGFVIVTFVRSGHDDTQPSRSEMYTIQRLFQGNWLSVATSGAYGDHTYHVLAPTQGDGEESGVAPFRVIAHMDEGIWISPQVTGYSEDNIAPEAPIDLHWGGPGMLSWGDSTIFDFSYFKVYGGSNNNFNEAETIAVTVDSFLDVSDAPFAWYFVVAVDDADLESSPASIPSGTSSATDLISRMSLGRATPNPFNPQTTISFSLPETGHTRLMIFDVSGRLVSTLIDETVLRGHHQVSWDGKDLKGNPVASGPFFYRLEGKGKVFSGRMMLVK